MSRPKTTAPNGTKKFPEEFQSSSTSTTFSFGIEDEYDTDIEDDGQEHRDHSCIGLYKRVCQHQQIVPIGEYLRSYEKKELKLHFYGLDPRGVRAFIPSLTVNRINDEISHFFSSIIFV